MHHLDHKAVILHSYEESVALHEFLEPIITNRTSHLSIFNQAWFNKNREPSIAVIYLTIYEGRLCRSFAYTFTNDSDYTLLPLKAIINSSDYPEYYI